MPDFKLVSSFEPRGDQAPAIESLINGVQAHEPHQVLLGVTGSGKTFVMASVIAQMNRPTMVLSHNKTLAAQLYAELRDFFPENAVEYFVSYYDYYQPEAYIPARDLYIEKDSSVNEDIERLRLSATASLLTRRDVIIVASVSAIYGLGSPDAAKEMMLLLNVGETVDPREIMKRLVDIQYERADFDFKRGRYRNRGDALEIWPAASEKTAIRIELPFDQVESIKEIHPLTGDVIRTYDRIAIYPARHFVLPYSQMKGTLAGIEAELDERLIELKNDKKIIEAHRLEARTRYDLELLNEIGFCTGIENYSRHLDARPPGSRPYCLLDYMPDDALLFIDESHVTIPQFGGMYKGDLARKGTLVEHGFRLPSALDNRPMTFKEFEAVPLPRIYVSATPGKYELEKTAGEIIELVIRPTGLVDPPIEIRPTANQVKDLLEELKICKGKGLRALVNTLTKRLAEDLSAYILDMGLDCRYLHSDIDAIERVRLLRDLRLGKFDALVGVNLLREGLDLPEVSLVAVMDADKQGFLRSRSSLIQLIGRAARNIDGRVIFYADRTSDAMRETIDECARRRTIQLEYNETNGITPETIRSGIKAGIEEILKLNAEADRIATSVIDPSRADIVEIINEMETRMLELADELKFEEAAAVRDQIDALRRGESVDADSRDRKKKGGRRKRAKRDGMPMQRTGRKRSKPDDAD
ncbi:MAG: excinuclease ABC subunit UvrB [Planctomycetota bacterium]